MSLCAFVAFAEIVLGGEGPGDDRVTCRSAANVTAFFSAAEIATLLPAVHPGGPARFLTDAPGIGTLRPLPCR